MPWRLPRGTRMPLVHRVGPPAFAVMTALGVGVGAASPFVHSFGLVTYVMLGCGALLALVGAVMLSVAIALRCRYVAAYRVHNAREMQRMTRDDASASPRSVASLMLERRMSAPGAMARSPSATRLDVPGGSPAARSLFAHGATADETALRDVRVTITPPTPVTRGASSEIASDTDVRVARIGAALRHAAAPPRAAGDDGDDDGES